jgi:hypothetical protein
MKGTAFPLEQNECYAANWLFRLMTSTGVNVRSAFWLTLTCLLAAAILGFACGDDDDSSGEGASDDDVLAAVTAALEGKNDWDHGSAEVTLEGVEDGRFAHGGVTDPAGSGALWFASLEDGEWEIVWDGNGIVDCVSLEPYDDFPTSLLPQCVGVNGNLEER